MKFGRVVGGATSGLAQALGALAMGDRTQQQAYDGEMLGQSRLAQAMAQAQQAQAAARQHDAEAAAKTADTARAAARPGIIDTALSASLGLDVPTLNAERQRLTTGQAPMVPMGPPAEDGGMGVGSLQLAPEVRSRIGQALLRMVPAYIAEKDINPENWAQAQGLFQDQDQEAAAARGEMTPMALAQLRYAAKGNAPFRFDSTGAVGNQLTGALATDNPMAQGSIALKREQAGAQKANAAQSYAAADSSRASAAKTRAEMADGTNRTGGKAPAGYRWAADGQSLEVIPGGPADPKTKGAKLAKPPTEGQAKALMFGTRMAAADEVLNDLGDKFSSGLVASKLALERVPVFGGMSAGSLNIAMSPENQMAEQAQRDFINALLRRESGAAIGADEFSNAQKQYFPQAGDSPAVLRQKAANRKAAISGLKAEFGEAMLPEFDRIVNESRAMRKAPAGAAPNTGGASGGWGDAPAAPPGQRVVRVPY